jgi:hypothetical protein
MIFSVGSRIFNLTGGSGSAKKAFEMITNYLGSKGGAKIISNPSEAQRKAATELSSARSQARQTLLKVGEEGQERANKKYWDAWANPPRRTKGIEKQSGETGEGLTEAQRAARSRASQKKFLEAEKPARKRQEGIQDAREKRRWAEDEDMMEMLGPLKDYIWPTKRKKGGKVGDKKQGYKARKDESIAERVKKKRTKKQLAASRDESYGKWGKGKGKGKINHADGNKLVASLYD